MLIKDEPKQKIEREKENWYICLEQDAMIMKFCIIYTMFNDVSFEKVCIKFFWKCVLNKSKLKEFHSKFTR